jgi:hypothetical protein
MGPLFGIGSGRRHDAGFIGPLLAMQRGWPKLCKDRKHLVGGAAMRVVHVRVSQVDFAEFLADTLTRSKLISTT